MRSMNMQDYLLSLKRRYLRTDRKGKIQILNEFCQTSGFHRKHVIRLLTRTLIGMRDKPPGRRKEYQAEELLLPLKQIWLTIRKTHDAPVSDKLIEPMPNKVK